MAGQSLGKQPHQTSQHGRAKRQRKESAVGSRSSSKRADTPVSTEPQCFKLLKLPNDAASNYLQSRVFRRVLELLLTEHDNFIHVQKVQLMALRFSRSKPVTNLDGEIVHRARRLQSPSILFTNRMAHRAGWKVASVNKDYLVRLDDFADNN